MHISGLVGTDEWHTVDERPYVACIAPALLGRGKSGLEGGIWLRVRKSARSGAR
ncbi:hypothetical protein GCM10022420_004220 [Streptomyces iranensis]|uniref:Transposase n=1 Tax=Streptomyces iranensis TaxID=576784 RepID=A0ABS4MRF7_9ACTN|nr:hypothetical protein [Streptomyces iranensis]